MKVYAVYNKTKEDIYRRPDRGPNNAKIFTTIGAAKRSLNHAKNNPYNETYEFEIIEFKKVEKED